MKKTALSRACFNSRQRSLLRRLYQRIVIQAPLVQGIRHRVYFMFLDWVKSLCAWVRIHKSGFDKGCFFLFSLFFYICIHCISLIDCHFNIDQRIIIEDISLRTDTQLRFSWHFTPLGIRLVLCVCQPFAFLVLETIFLGHYSTYC